MPILFFFFLFVIQVAIAVIGCVGAFVVTMVSGMRAFRWQAIRASLFGAGGAYVGAVAAYVAVIAIGLAWKLIELLHLAGPAVFLANAAPWLLLVGYLGGLLGGSYAGWKFRMPAFKHWALK